MAVATFIAVGLCSALALCLAAVLLVGLVVTVSAIVRVTGILFAILAEEREGRRNRPVARARDRWVGAWRNHW